ncbi:MAG: hypothetical protein J0M24_17815 [Verrucomicrobia bacterium]|nr:hypothetical protein [Verrucomicrobiota bacterium]
MPILTYRRLGVERAFRAIYFGNEPLAQRVFDAAVEFSAVEPQRIADDACPATEEVETMRMKLLEYGKTKVDLSDLGQRDTAKLLAAGILSIWLALPKLGPA